MIIPYNHKRKEQVIKRLLEIDNEFAEAYKNNQISLAVSLGIEYNKIYPEFLDLKDAKQRFLNP